MKRRALELRDVWYSYALENQFVPALRGLNLTINEGEMVAIQGPSGSGKSTLLYLLGCMLRPQKGVVQLFERDVSQMSDLEMATARNHQLGFVFQQFHLLSRATVLENILLPSKYPFESGAQTTEKDVERAKMLAAKVGLSDRLDHFPNQLSGGQQQRVAIARALMRNAPMILADEPTGNLDSHTSNEILKLLTDLNREGRTVVIITHDNAVADKCQRVLHIFDGVIDRENRVDESSANTRATFEVNRGSDSWKDVSSSRHFISMLRDSAPLAFSNLKRNKLRSLLTMMGVVIGVASVLSMVTLGQYTKEKLLQSYATMGVNSMIFYANPDWNYGGSESAPSQFTALNWQEEVLPLKKMFPEILRLSPQYDNYSGMSAIYAGRSVEQEVSVTGVNEEALKISRRGIALGTGIQAFHVKNKSSVCVIGYEIAQRLFLKESPIGEVIQIATQNSSFSCLVVGVLQPSPTKKTNYGKPDLEILIPFSYFVEGPFESYAKDLASVLIEVRPGTDIVKTGQKIQGFFERKYGASGKFNASSDSVLISQMNRFLSLFTILLALIASLSLVVGAMGITNMMLVSVTERFREIGLRKALGASDYSVRLQFITESLVLCFTAGFVGILLGVGSYQGLIWAGTQLIPNLQFEWVWDWTAAIIATSAIGLTGFLSGLTPAIRAERLQVIEALRSE